MKYATKNTLDIQSYHVLDVIDVVKKVQKLTIIIIN
jgi:hypothetical protein